MQRSSPPYILWSKHVSNLSFLASIRFATSFEDGVEMTDRVGTPEYSECDGAVLPNFMFQAYELACGSPHSMPSPLHQCLRKSPNGLTLAQSVTFGQVRKRCQTRAPKCGVSSGTSGSSNFSCGDP